MGGPVAGTTAPREETEATPDEASQRFEGPQHGILAVGEDDTRAGHPGAPVVNLQGQLPQNGLRASDTLELCPELRPGGGGGKSASSPAPGQGVSGSGWLYGPLQGRLRVRTREPQPAGDTHTLHGTSLRVTRTSSSEPVSRWVPLMVSVVPPACGPCFGSTLRGWGCWKSNRFTRIRAGALEPRPHPTPHQHVTLNGQEARPLPGR